MNDSDRRPRKGSSRSPSEKVIETQPDTQPPAISQPLPSPALEVKGALGGKFVGLARCSSEEIIALIAEKEEINSREARSLAFVYSRIGVLLLLLGLLAPFIPVSSFEERLFASTSLPLHLILRTLGFVGAISMASWYLRMHYRAIIQHWRHKKQEIEALHLLGDVRSLRDHPCPEDVRERLKDHRVESARIKDEHVAEPPEISNRIVDKLFDVAGGIIGRRKK